MSPLSLHVLWMLLYRYAGCSLVQMGPTFVLEPPSLVQYAAASGARVACVARGDPPPRVTWLGDDGAPLADIAGLRRVHNNGTLELAGQGGGGGGGGYRGTLPSSYRCRAANTHGTVLSRDVTLQPVSEESWEAVSRAPPAAEGGVAGVWCSAAPGTTAPGAAADLAPLVDVAVWYRDDQLVNAEPPHPGSRYLVAGNALLIREARAEDSGSYSCLARHRITGGTKRSRPAHLTVSAGSLGAAPRLVGAQAEASVAAGADLCVPCVAQGHPSPRYTWYREAGGRLSSWSGGERAWLWSGGAALCVRRAQRQDGGAWLCKAHNLYGDASAQLRLDVRETLTAHVQPPVQVADTGSTVRFNCTVSDEAAATRWLHDGVPVGGGARELLVHGVARAHRGMYQCVARRGHDSAQAAAELRLGDTAPELHYTFIEQALRAGGAVSLRCAASGSPPPRFTWLLDNQPVDQYLAAHRYSVNEQTSLGGDVVSVLNVSAAAADGGRYTCRAHNALGHAHHSARLNIYGSPSIRALGPVRVVAGANATVYCPYAGYPISSIAWWRRGERGERALDGAGRVSARGAELRLAPALAADAGVYACAVTAPDGTAARRDIDVQVRNPPKISPFIFSSELTEGSSVQVLCGVSSGDKPLYFSWVKDGAPIPTSLQIQEKSLDEFSFLMFSDVTARHSGDYTCRVANHAATVNYTATLSVKVAPSWSLEPTDAAVLLGAPLSLHCAARGSPQPRLAWYRKIGEGVVGSDGTSGEQWEELTHGLEWGGAAETNGSLMAAAAARAHQGVYRCRADNGVGPPLTKHVNVTVHEPAHFGSSSGARNVSCVRGAGATLTCDVLGDAPIRVQWTHRARRIDYDTYRVTMEDVIASAGNIEQCRDPYIGTGDVPRDGCQSNWSRVSVSEARTASGLRSILTLRASERGDAGEYRCHAENAYGRSEALLYLIVQEPPEAPRALRLGGAGGRWARLVWRAGHAGGAHALAYSASVTPLHARDERERQFNLTAEPLTPGTRSDEPDGEWGARLESLRPATAYSVRLSAANHVGVSPHSEPLLFTTLEEGPSGTPQNVRVRAAGPGELHVSWSAPEQDTWNGELLGYVVSWRGAGGGGAGAEESHGSLTAAGWGSSELTLSGLRKYAQYTVAVKAYNSVGAGPPSPAIFATTAEGVPEAAPQEVRCDALSSRAVRVRWQPPPPGARAGLLRGYDVLYAPHNTRADSLHSWGDTGTAGDGGETARVGATAGAGEATLQGLRRATNYSIVVRARTDAGAGVPSGPLYCATLEDVPGSPADVKALVRGSDGVVVTWSPPAQRNGKLTHYTLYTREAGKSGKEWSQRVEASEPPAPQDAGGGGEASGASEVTREVRGLRERQLYEFWVTAATASGAGPPSHIVTAAPSSMVPARIASFGGWVRAAAGTRVRLRCAALGAPPLVRTWAPLPASRDHTITDSGDMLIHRAERALSGNYTCRVRNGLGADSVTYALRVLLAPAAPALRLVRAAQHALHLAWDAPEDGGTPIQGYTLWWRRADTTEDDARSDALPGGETAHALEGLACGTAYRLTLRAHNAVGAGAHSQPLIARTRGDKAKAASGKEFVWTNSTHLRLNLLAWAGGRCPVSAWSVWVRGSGEDGAGDGGEWRAVRAAGEAAEAGGLRPGAWYEVRVLARSPAGDTAALYRVPTATSTGERIGEPTELPLEASESGTEAGDGRGSDAAWRAGAGPALLGGGAAAALLTALIVALLLWRHKRPRHRPACLRRAHSVQEVRCAEPRARRDTQQLYTTEPGKRNGKVMTPPDDLHEISPYATFSMAEGGGGGGLGSGAPAGGGAGVTRCGSGCLLHLRTFGRGEPLDLAAPPSRPNLLRHHADEYGRSKGRSTRADTDSESSGSPCAECAGQLYRMPHDADTLPAAVESSAEETSCGAGGAAGAAGAAAGARGAARGRRRRDHSRHPSAGTARYFSNATLLARHQAL